MVFDSLWKNFDARFQTILASMRRHRDLIDQEASAIDITEAKKWRTERLEEITKWRAEALDAVDRQERERAKSQVCVQSLRFHTQ